MKSAQTRQILHCLSRSSLNGSDQFQVPVYKMGQMFLYDWVNGHTSVEDFTLFNLDDIDGAFERVQQVKYSQTVLFNILIKILRNVER